MKDGGGFIKSLAPEAFGARNIMEQTMNTERLSQRFPALLLLLTLMCVWSQATASPLPLKSKDESARLFAYNRAVAFDLKEVSAREQDGVSVRDVDYAAYTQQRGRIKAYLVRPAGKGPYAGVLFFHWLGKPNGNRNQFLDEAVALARQGTVSLLIQGYFPWAIDPVDGKTDRQRVIDETIEVRRALDLLLSQPGVDRQRIGYVGHDYGAMYGAIVAGVDKRVKTFILMAPIGSFSYWSLAYWLKDSAAPFKEAYRQSLNAVDPVSQIPRAAPATLLFQFANSDEHIPKAEAIAFSDAASKPKEVKWYDARHDLLVEAALQDRREWLARQLGLAKQTGK
jgi:dienelactone hydrolase